MNLMQKSIQVLKNLQLKNGGILATPVNGAYPYVYIRDGVLITKALNKVKLTINSKKFYHFINRFAKPDQYKEIFHRYYKDGWPAVSRKHEHDNTGLLLHGIYDTYVHSKNKFFLEDMWPLVQKCCKFIYGFSNTGLVKTNLSIHELYRLEHGYELWANCACCRGLYDASKIAEVMGHEKESKEWYKKAEKLHNNIKTKMFNKKTGLFMKNLKYPKVTDSSQISPFYFNLVDSKVILKRTLKHLKENLWYEEVGGFRRFKRFEICKDWHWYTGGSGGWTVFTAIMGRLYKELGDKKNYQMCLDWLENTANKNNGMLPEHTATKLEYETWKMNEIEFNTRILKGMKKTEKLNEKIKRKYKEDIVYWAFPFGWGHAEYILLKKNV